MFGRSEFATLSSPSPWPEATRLTAIRLALRSLRRSPAYALTVILTLALGLAAAGAMFAIVHGVLLEPLPYAQPEQLVSVGLESPEQSRLSQPAGVQAVYQQHARALQAVALYRGGSSNVRLPDAADADSVPAAWVSASMLPLLRVAPLLGRGFSAEEELRGGPNAVILSEAEWRARFGAAADVVGRTLIVNDAPRTVVGVMPAGFAFPNAATRVWLPLKRTDSGLLEDFLYTGVARLAPGVGVEQAQAELAGVLPRLAELFPRLASGGSTAAWLEDVRPRPLLQPLREAMTGGIARTLWMLAAAAALVLLVAWANVANLALVRADAGQAGLAVREALGAGRWRAAAHVLAESALLGLAAGALALLAAHAAVRALVAFGPADVPRLHELGVGLAGAGSIGLLVLAGVALGAALPVLRTQRGSLSRALHAGARQTSGKPRQRLRAAIAAGQMALALVVLIGAALLLRTAQRLQAVDPGFQAADVTTLRILLPYARYGDAARLAFQSSLVERVRQLPQVEAAGLALQLPLASPTPLEQRFLVPDEAQPRTLPVNVVGDGYFAALRIPLLAGRDFRGLDAPQAGELVLSRRAAAELYGDANIASAVGRSLSLAGAGPSYTVVGVAGDVHQTDLAGAPPPLVYLPQALPAPRPGMALALRTAGAVDALPAVRQILRELDPTVPVFEVQRMHEVVRASTARLRLMLLLMTAAAAVALLLGMIGLYGVMAYLVALRTREFGVRLALGADPPQIARWVVGHGLALAATGIAAGLLLYALAAPFLRAFVYGVSVSDPVTLAGAMLLLAATAGIASWLPARRAARVDPALALRAGCG